MSGRKTCLHSHVQSGILEKGREGYVLLIFFLRIPSETEYFNP